MLRQSQALVYSPLLLVDSFVIIIVIADVTIVQLTLPRVDDSLVILLVIVELRLKLTNLV